jgi:hypothetical protein
LNERAYLWTDSAKACCCRWLKPSPHSMMIEKGISTCIINQIYRIYRGAKSNSISSKALIPKFLYNLLTL